MRGFSTLELMIAFAISILTITAIIGVNYGAQYWVIASQTSNEGLYKAKTVIEHLRAIAKQDFYLASSTAAYRDISDSVCAGGGLCYYPSSIVTDYSPCSKLAEAETDWRVSGYPTTTATLYTNLTSPNEIVHLGGDCLLNQPSGTWASMSDTPFPSLSAGTPTGLDVLDGTEYMTTDSSPYFRIASTSLAAFVSNNFNDNVTLNAVDAARDESTGRVYAYVARNYGVNPIGQLTIIDVTTVSAVASTTYALPGTTFDGWRVAFYDRKAYVLTKYNVGNPELYIVDVSTPTSPADYGNHVDIGTTANDIVVRDRFYSGATHRFVYLATTHDTKELTILDYSTPSGVPTQISFDLPDTGCALANKPDAKTLYLSGSTLYIGREYSPSCASLPNLYAIDVSNPHAPTILASQTLGGSVTSMRGSGPFLFLGVGTGGASKVQVWNADPKNLTQVIGSNFPISQLGEQGIDIDGNDIYAAVNSGQPLHKIHSP